MTAEAQMNEFRPKHDGDKAGTAHNDDGLKVCLLDVVPTREDFQRLVLSSITAKPQSILDSAAKAQGKELWHDADVPGSMGAAVAVSRVLQDAGEIVPMNRSVMGLAAALTSKERQEAGTAYQKFPVSEHKPGDVIVTDHYIGIVGKNDDVFTNSSRTQQWVDFGHGTQRYENDPHAYVLRSPHDK